MKVLVAQSCPTLCNPMDCSLPGSSAWNCHGILQARILELVVISFSRASSWPRVEPESPALQANSLPSEPPRKPNRRIRTWLNSYKVNQNTLWDIKLNLYTACEITVLSPYLLCTLHFLMKWNNDKCRTYRHFSNSGRTVPNCIRRRVTSNG